VPKTSQFVSATLKAKVREIKIWPWGEGPDLGLKAHQGLEDTSLEISPEFLHSIILYGYTNAFGHTSFYSHKLTLIAGFAACIMFPQFLDCCPRFSFQGHENKGLLIKIEQPQLIRS